MAASEVRPSETREEQAAEQRGRQEIQGQAKDEKTDDDEATTADGQVSTPVGWQRNRRDTLSQESGEAIYKAWQLTELKNRGKEKIANGRISTSEGQEKQTAVQRSTTTHGLLWWECLVAREEQHLSF